MKPIEKEIIEFSILKELTYNDNIPTAKNYNIDEDNYVAIFKDMINQHYINSKRVRFNILRRVEIDKELDLVTDIGIKFVESHEGWNKIYMDLNDLNKLLDKDDKND